MVLVEIIKQFNLKSLIKSVNGTKRIVMMFSSILLMGFSVSVFSYSNLGVDPFTSMNMAVSAKLGIGYGTYQLCVNLILFIITVAFGKQLIGFGTVVNMVGVGYICQFFTSIYSKYLPAENPMVTRVILMIVGVVLLSLAASLYFTSSLGVAPYDALGFIIEHKTNLPYKWCRVITDLICTGIGFIFAGPVGVGTVVTAFFMGPIIAFFNKYFSSKLLEGNLFSLKDVKVRYYDFRHIGGGFVASNGRYST